MHGSETGIISLRDEIAFRSVFTPRFTKSNFYFPFAIQAVHIAARTHTQKSKGTVGPAVDYRLQGEALPVISADLTSELLHCLSTLLDPWPLAKINIDMEKPSQWVSKLCRLYFADKYAKRTVGLPSRRHVPDIAGTLRAVQAILPNSKSK